MSHYLKRKMHQPGYRPAEDKQASSSINDNYDDEEAALLKEVLEYRQVNDVHHVGPTDVLWILKKMGYRKVASKDGA